MKVKKAFAKQLLGILLCAALVLTYGPMTAFAAGYGDNGYNTTHDGSYEIDGNDVFVYVTGSGGTVERISGGDSDSVQQYRAVASDNWEFAYWSTYYVGPSTQAANPTAALGYYYFSKPGDKESTYNKTNPVIQVNEEMWARGTYYLQAIFKPKVTISVNRQLPASGQSIRGESPATYLDNVFISGSMPYINCSLGGWWGVAGELKNIAEGFYAQVGLGMSFGNFSFNIGYHPIVVTQLNLGGLKIPVSGIVAHCGYVKLGVRFGE